MHTLTLHPSSKSIPPINSKRLPIQILITRKKQHRGRHILIPPRPPRNNLISILLLRNLALLLLISRLLGRHLARENARRDTVHPDLQPIGRNLLGKHAVHVDRRRLGRVIREMVLRLLNHAADAADVDDGAGPAVLLIRGLLQQGEEARGDVEDGRDVCAVRLGPVFEVGGGVVEEAGLHVLRGVALDFEGGAGDAGVVDEDVEGGFLGLDFFEELVDVGFLGDVCDDGDDGAGDVLAVGLDGVVELGLVAGGDVDFCAVGGEGLGCH